QEAAEIARIQAQPIAQEPQVRALGGSEFEQKPGFAKRPAARKVAVLEGADAPCDRAVEAAKDVDLGTRHYLTLVRQFLACNREASCRPASRRCRPMCLGKSVAQPLPTY